MAHAAASFAPALYDRFAAAIDTLSPPHPWAIAVSGGPDSLCLMHLAARLCAARKWPKPLILTFDHGLRAGSAKEAVDVAGWAASLGLAHKTLVHAGSMPETGIQEFARRARYQAMGSYCAARSIKSLLVAHHLDDLFETVAMRAARGAASANDGMAMMARLPGIAFNDVAVVRPLLFEPKAVLVAHMQALGQAFHSDPTNSDLRFERARLRHSSQMVRPLITKILEARRARAEIERDVQTLFAEHVRVHEAGFYLAPRKVLLSGEAAAQRLLRELIARVSGAEHLPTDSAVAALVGHVRESGAASLLKAQVRAAPRQLAGPDHLIVCVETPRAAIAPFAPDPAGAPFVWQGRFDVCVPEPHREIVVAPLGLARVAQLRRENKALQAIPARALAMVPALYRGEQLLAAPQVLLQGTMTAQFRHRPWLAYAEFPQTIPMVTTGA